MGDEWESPRQRQHRKEGIINMLKIGAVLILIGISYSIACRPLPSNLDSLVVSPGAIERLHKAVAR